MIDASGKGDVFLQWSRGTSPDEMRSALRDRAWPRGFNGADETPSDETMGPRRSRTGQARFNGAVEPSTDETTPGEAVQRAQYKLQWSRGDFHG